jgi:hypothetical protein
MFGPNEDEKDWEMLEKWQDQTRRSLASARFPKLLILRQMAGRTGRLSQLVAQDRMTLLGLAKSSAVRLLVKTHPSILIRRREVMRAAAKVWESTPVASEI